jgi:hypothetical protein
MDSLRDFQGARLSCNMICNIGVLLIIWYCVLPPKDNMIELEHAYPEVHSYISTNLTLYIISISLYAASCLLLVLPIAQMIVVLLLVFFGCLGVPIWSCCNASVVYNKDFALDLHFRKAHNVAMAMFWMRAVTLMLWGCVCCCASLGGILALASRNFAPEKDTKGFKKALIEGEN